MNLESLAKGITLLSEIEEHEDRSKINERTIAQSSFKVNRNEMVLETVQQKKFSQLNKKRYCFQCGIVSLPFSCLHLCKINELKWYKNQTMENWFLKEKEILKKIEKEAVFKNHRVLTLDVKMSKSH